MKLGNVIDVTVPGGEERAVCACEVRGKAWCPGAGGEARAEARWPCDMELRRMERCGPLLPPTLPARSLPSRPRASGNSLERGTGADRMLPGCS